ncbi:hypothetical protein CPB84DRAFT_1814696 [Gymnopilus junonius]|uniref:Uncharacterized protein n=1 Tax=Gymnopilus junonius TaxID=109634 RepID=A0A9P5NNK7_GYMJU|nr:hypothetical protein CPB84DRAFT_1814696 [Gymnopilus junonius]
MDSTPDKREITLILLSLIIYFLARLGFGRTRVIGKDGRKYPGWRDSLELAIFGDWTWEEGHVAGDGSERSQPKGTGRHGAMWIENPRAIQVDDEPLGDSTVDNALQRWGDDLPQTRVVKHAPGYNVLDNVYVFNGTVYVIADRANALPPMSTIVSHAGNGFAKWEILSTEEGRKLMGSYGSTIRGVSWMDADSTPHNSTLFALWRTYSSLDRAIDSTGHTRLPPPRRLIFPHNRFFTDENPPYENHWIKRVRAETGFHPYLAKAAFPQLTVQYYEDWDDYQKMEIPFILERLVVVDRTIAEKTVMDGLPVYSPAFDLDTSDHWWEPVRRNLAQFLEEYEINPRAKKAVTYLHTQSDSSPKLSTEEHQNLVRALEKMARSRGYELHIVSTQTSETDWTERMTAIVKSSLILSVHGNHLMDAVFMRPTPQSTLVELFPSGKFVRDREFAMRSLGLHYVAWQGSRPFTSELPPISPPRDEAIEIDVQAIVRSIHETLSRS